MSDVRRAIDAGWFVGPTIIDSGKIIAPFGGQSRDIPPRQGAFWQFESSRLSMRTSSAALAVIALRISAETADPGPRQMLRP